MTEIITNSPAETELFAEEFAKSLKGGEIIAFKGSMGMGKTCFTRGLAKGLGFSGQVTSPTFAPSYLVKVPLLVISLKLPASNVAVE